MQSDNSAPLNSSAVESLYGASMLGQTLLSLLVVVALILLLGLLARKLLRPTRSKDDILQQIATTHLGPRERLVLIAFRGNTELLLGISNGNISLIHKHDRQALSPPNTDHDFDRMLAAHSETLTDADHSSLSGESQ